MSRKKVPDRVIEELLEEWSDDNSDNFELNSANTALQGCNSSNTSPRKTTTAKEKEKQDKERRDGMKNNLETLINNEVDQDNCTTCPQKNISICEDVPAEKFEPIFQPQSLLAMCMEIVLKNIEKNRMTVQAETITTTMASQKTNKNQRVSKAKAYARLAKETEEFIDIFQDSGSEYNPTEDGTLSRSVSPSLLQDTEITPPEEYNVNKKSRKRQKNEANWKKNIRKAKRARGEEYVNAKGNKIAAKTPCLDDAACSCPSKCIEKIGVLQRLQLFESFYKLGSYDLQNANLISLIDISSKARTYTNADTSRRQRTCFYHLTNESGEKIRVCKQFFLKVLQVSDGRVSRLIQNKTKHLFLSTDQRGKNPSVNKTPTEKIEEVKSFINGFPSYESHYTRHKSEKKYLSPDLNISIMYNLYKENCSSTPVSQHLFRQIFNNDFNLSFHCPIKDSCKRCDSFSNKIKYGDENQRTQIQQEHELHLRKADAARSGMTADAEKYKQSNNTAVIAFDLMKTLPTPVISTGVCYYKRQLWTYCLGIHDLLTDEGFMYVWDESTGSRGPQEIGSCLLHYIKTYVNCEHLIMYSDQCGGQNRNIKMALLCQYIVSHPDFSVNKIDHKFLMSGHSYLPCDQDFGLIEKKKKYFNNIFAPQDWIQVIKAARTKAPFHVIVMDSTMIYSTQKLEKNITNRKKGLRKEKVEWLKFQWIHITKEEPFLLKYKYSNNEDVEFEVVDFKKRRASVSVTNLDQLYPNGNSITKEKKKDLMELLHYIPPSYHDFYKSLKTNDSDRDLGLVQYYEYED